MERNELEKKIQEDPDFIHAPRFGNSLQKFLNKLDNPCENGTIGRLLLLSSEEVEKIYQESVVLLRKEMVDDYKEDSE